MPTDRDDAVEKLLALWIEQEPDPVDIFEDELLRRLGSSVTRHSAWTSGGE